jgi:hypothetical protein
LTLNASNVVTYRTGAEVLSDIGGQGALTLTTTGVSGAATLVGNTLNIPQYQAVLSGTGIVKSTGGTISYLTDNSTNWNSAYDNMIVSAAVTGTTTKTLTLTQQDSGTVTASWTDDNTDAVTSVFGRTGAVVATEGDYSLTQLSDVTITSPSNGQVLKYNGTTWVNDTDANTGTVTSVGLSAPTGFSVTNSPVTSSGTLTLSFASGYSLPTTASQTNWDTAYTNRITSLTTTGSSGAATLVSNTLNIPNYTLAGLGGVSGSGTTNYIPKFTSSSAIGNSQIFDNGSNVGINIASPAAMLDVNGAGLIRGFLTTTDAIKLGANTSAPTSTDAFIYRPADNTLAFGTASSERLRISSTGNVGIGTSSPSYKLSLNTGVAGVLANFTDGVAQTLRISTGSGFVALDNPSAGAIAFQIASSERMRLDASGNLGIGTSSPAYKLDVAGTSNITSSAYFGGLVQMANNKEFQIKDASGNPANVLFMFTDNNVYLSSPVSGSSLIFRGVGYTERMRLDASGNLGLGVTPSAWTTSFGFGKAIEVGALGNSIWGAGGGDIALFSNAYYNSNFIYASSNYATGYRQQDGVHKWLISSSGTAGNAISFTQAMTLASTGNLLVGTTTDGGQKLQVNGDGKFSSSSSSSVIIQRNANTNGATIDFNTSTTNNWFLGLRGLSNNNFYIFNQTAGVNNLILDATTGAATFSSSVTAGGSVSITDGQYFIYDTRADAANRNWVLVSNANVFGDFSIRQSNAKDGNPLTSGTDRLTINPSGNVGIGTTSPTEGKLVVANSGPSIIYNKETSVGVNSFWNASDGSIVQFGVVSNHPLIMLTNNTERMRITSGGNVGIGSTNPTRLLDVNGVIRTQNAGSAGAPSIELGTSAQGNGLFYPTTNTIAISTNDTERMRITSGGDVAINTTTANSKLHVAGSLRLPLVTKSATYTLDATDYTVGFDCTGANRTANLPDATTCSGRIYVIYQFGGGSTYGVTIDGNSSQTINGSATYVLQGYCDYSSVMIQSDGSNWVVISDALQTGCL